MDKRARMELAERNDLALKRGGIVFIPDDGLMSVLTPDGARLVTPAEATRFFDVAQSGTRKRTKENDMSTVTCFICRAKVSHVSPEQRCVTCEYLRADLAMKENAKLKYDLNELKFGKSGLGRPK